LPLIKKCKLDKGELSEKKLSKVLAWAKEHANDLLKNWRLAMAKKPLERIEPPVKKRKKK